jgi:hypothetical protein
MFHLAQMPPPQLPPLPEGPTLDNVRGPIETASFSGAEIALATIAGLLIIAALVWLFLRSRKRPEVPVDPEQAALAELEAASAASDDERYAILCANSVRRLLQARYDLPVTCQTSSEITRVLPIPKTQQGQLKSFLDQCDRVKFAGQPLSPEERIQLSDTARSLIDEIRKESAAT